MANQLSIARWVTLGFVAVEVFTLTMAVLLRFVIKEEQPYNSFDAETAEQRSNTLSTLARDIEKFASKSKVSKSLSQLDSMFWMRWHQFAC